MRTALVHFDPLPGFGYDIAFAWQGSKAEGSLTVLTCFFPESSQDAKE